MTLKPGIGANWFRRFADDVYRRDVLVDSRGRETRPPRYYDKLQKRQDADFDVNVLQAREVRGREHAHDNTRERLAVKAEVLKARISTLKRNL